MRAALYLRVSTDEQAVDGYSIAAQTEKLTAYAHSQGWTIGGRYADEGFSAGNTDRPALQRLLRDIRRQQLDVVLVYRLDRLTRSVLDLYQLLEEFERHGVKFRSCTEVYDTTTAIGRLFITLVAALAQWERENLAERVKLGMEQMARERKRPGGPPPYGYTLQNGQLVINVREAPLVRYLFARYLAGEPLAHIAAQLNEMGCRSRTGARWSPVTLAHMLKNHAYYGALRWNYTAKGQKVNQPAEWVVREGTHEPLIDKATFWQAQEMIAARGRKHPRTHSSPFIFAGVLTCYACGQPLYGKTIRSSRRGQVQVRRYYLCSGRKRQQCTAKAITEEQVEQLLLPLLTRIWPASSPVAPFRRMPAYHDHLQQQWQQLQEQAARWEDAYAAGVISLAQLEVKLSETKAQAKHLRQQLVSHDTQREDSVPEAVRLLTNIGRVWQIATVPEKKRLVSLLIREMVIQTQPPAVCRVRYG